MEKQQTFTDYLSLLYKWKKFIIINLLVIGSIATIISFLIPKTYKATSKIILAPENSSSLGGLSSLLSSSNSALSVGAKLFGVSSTDEDLILGLLNSRTVIENVVNRYNLYDYYEEDEKNYDKLIKKMSDDIIFEPNEYGMIEVSVINENPNLSAQIADYFVTLVDSINIELGIRGAKNNRIFVERRYNKNVDDLRNAEDSLYLFQKEYGIFAVPEQLEISVKAAAEIEAMLVQRELMLNLLKETKGENSIQYLDQLSEVKVLRKKVNELKYSDKLSSNSNVLFPFKNIPDLIVKYYRLFRDVEIQSKILQFTLPMFEQAKLDEQKSIPTVLVIDKASIPQLKYGPKKAFIIIGACFLIFFISILLIFRGEGILNKTNYNIIELKEKSLYQILQKIYKLK